MTWSSPGTVFQCEFSCDNDYVIRRLYFENIWYSHHQALFFSMNSIITVIVSSGGYILKICDMVITNHCFSMWIQLWQWLCHPETIFWKYMIWSSPALFFSVNSVVTVIVSSGGYILKIYDIVITKHCFQCEFSCDSDYVIWRLYFENIWYGHHQTSFSISHLLVVVMISSEDYILVISSKVMII